MSKLKFKLNSVEVNKAGGQQPCKIHNLEFKPVDESKQVNLTLKTSDQEEAANFQVGEEYLLVSAAELDEVFSAGKAAGIDEGKAAAIAEKEASQG